MNEASNMNARLAGENGVFMLQKASCPFKPIQHLKKMSQTPAPQTLAKLLGTALIVH